MKTCLGFDDHQRDDSGKAFVIRTESITMMSNGWKRLQIRCKNRSSLSTGSMEGKTFNFDQYFMLDDDDDDGYDEGAMANPPTNLFPVDEKQDILHIPQWSKTMVEFQSDATKDLCIISSSDDEVGDETDSDESFSNIVAATLNHTTTQDEMIGAFPNYLENQYETLTKFDPPFITSEDIEDICGVSFLRPGDNNRRKKYRPQAQKRMTKAQHVSDSETEEDSSVSSIPELGVLNSSNDSSSFNNESCNNNKQRRSIRFSDEVLGQSLTTIHLIPWSEHDDPEWIPRPVRCRIEL